MKLTLEQLKENFLNNYITERDEFYSDDEGCINCGFLDVLEKDIKEMKKKVTKVKSIKDIKKLAGEEGIEI